MKLHRILALVALFLFWSATSYASSYDAALPPQLFTDPDLCAYAPCREVLPGADGFSVRKGRPSYVEAYRTVGAQRQVIGYVFLSIDIVDIPAYSGKPVITLIGMYPQGVISGVRILKHSEPILLVGIPEGELAKFIAQYVGKFAGAKVEIGKSSAGDDRIGLNAISGATVTVIAENQVIMRSAYAIAKQVGIVKSVPKPPARFTAQIGLLDWKILVDEGSVQHLTVQPEELGIDASGQPYIDLYFGYLNAPAVGRSVLGEAGWKRLMAELKPDEHAIFIVANGTASFKGSGFVRGGIYDRIQVAQDLDSHTFRDTDYQNLYGIAAAGAPAYKESAIFILRGGNFSAAYPWSLLFLANKVDRQSGSKTFANFEREYWLHDRYLEGGRPMVLRPDPTWVQVWRGKKTRNQPFRAAARCHRRPLCPARPPGTSRHPQGQTLGVDPQVPDLDAQHRFRRLLQPGPAERHPRHDLAAFAGLSMALGAVPVRSADLHFLAVHRRRAFRLGPWSVLRLALSLRFAV